MWRLGVYGGPGGGGGEGGDSNKINSTTNMLAKHELNNSNLKKTNLLLTPIELKTKTNTHKTILIQLKMKRYQCQWCSY